jgi:serine/threonine protein kinase
MQTAEHYQYDTKYCLGEGNYGKVFHGKDLKTDKDVAIK